ncbi:MAG: 3-hydroxyacyl-CoA dehydrogenase NAD-binding domain-containing protein, partial [Planctomycetota bacterium]
MSVGRKMKVQEIAVIGAGRMGAGIAQLAATHGCRVRLIDVDADVLAHAAESINKRLDRSIEKGRMNRAQRDAVLGSISTSETISDLDSIDLAIETVVEDLSIKRKVLAQLESAVPDSAVLATNTSSLSITRIAESLSDPSRLIGMHFFNPAPAMPLVEIVAGEASDRSHVDAAFSVARSWGKTAVLAKDTPGFIVNRIARGFYLEALRLLAEGVGGVDEIDQVVRRHGRFRMGPFELMDFIGLDVSLAVGTSIWERFHKPTRLEPHEIQKQLVASGHLGRKSRRGFYSYKYDTPLPAYQVDRRSFQLSPLLSDVMLAFSIKAGAVEAGSTEQYMLCRILGAVINEAALAYEEAIASADDIDIAMVKGANYPTGPLVWADEIGHRTVRGMLKALNNSVA